MDVRNLYVEFQDKTIKKQTLQELKEIIDWLQIHIEIDSVLLTSKHKDFGEGWNREEWKSLTSPEIQTCIEDLRQISFKLVHLPQTVVADLKRKASNTNLKLTLALI